MVVSGGLPVYVRKRARTSHLGVPSPARLTPAGAPQAALAPHRRPPLLQGHPLSQHLPQAPTNFPSLATFPHKIRAPLPSPSPPSPGQSPRSCAARFGLLGLGFLSYSFSKRMRLNGQNYRTAQRRGKKPPRSPQREFALLYKDQQTTKGKLTLINCNLS